MNKAQLDLYKETVNQLHSKWKPHETQLKILKSLFKEDKRQIFVQCGRKWGKSESVIYMLWRWAMLNPGSSCYYISPYQKQSKEIVWASGRLQNFGPREKIKSINHTEMRITLTNGSFIKCDGSENYEAYRGITPHMVIYDEFKDFRSEFHVAMSPNLAVHNAPLIIIGTPPNRDGQYTELAEEFKADASKAWFCFPTESNPHIDKTWLEKERQTLVSRGESDVWVREYEGRFVKGGKDSVFPMLKKQIVVKHDLILNEIKRDAKKLNWYCIADPGTTTCFATLILAINPYSKKIYLLDELYEKDQARTSTRIVIGNLEEKLNGFPVELESVYFGRDEAAAWFEVEAFDLKGYPFCFVPVTKHRLEKEQGLSLIKDIILACKLVISDKCKWIYWEMENMIKIDGKVPKENDHLCDCLRYALVADNYSLLDVAEPIKESEKEEFRGKTIAQDLWEDGLIDELNEFSIDLSEY